MIAKQLPRVISSVAVRNIPVSNKAINDVSSVDVYDEHSVVLLTIILLQRRANLCTSEVQVTPTLYIYIFIYQHCLSVYLKFIYPHCLSVCLNIYLSISPE